MAAIFAMNGFRIILLLSLIVTPLLQAETNSPSAKITVSGYGFFGNRELKSSLGLLFKDATPPPVLDAAFIEDATMILLARVTRDGYLNASIEADLTLTNGSHQKFVWRAAPEEPLDRKLAISKADFFIRKGKRFYYKNLAFPNLSVLTKVEATDFFFPTDALLPTRGTKVYSPQKFATSLRNLEQSLQNRGYERAVVTSTNLVINTNQGFVQATILMHPGPQSRVRNIEQIVRQEKNSPPENSLTVTPDVPYSRFWEQDYIQAIRRSYFHEGFADVSIELTQIKREQTNDVVSLHFRAEIITGQPVTVGSIVIHGPRSTKESVIRRRIPLQPGDLLDPVKADEGRHKLARLGIFNSVSLAYEPAEAQSRDLVYTLTEGKQVDFSLLFGYGSYERLRGGFDLEQFNVFGRAHHQRLRAIQSFKSTSADYTYSMPELFGEELDAFINGSGL
ncbi:MAG: POTRA domain-containing protein, partial [Verrucomicrobiota bacterium]|nr:POTRA domain-containing protein [Verrucomicrobiota bacterium]